jgi:hypothetical protein
MNLICLKFPLGYLRRASTDGRHVPVENFRLAGGALEGDGPAHRGGVTPGRGGNDRFQWRSAQINCAFSYAFLGVPDRSVM